MSTFHSIEWKDGMLRLLDQRALPHQTRYNTYTTAQDVADAIRQMVTRGAPAIGAAAAYGLALTAQRSQAANPARLLVELEADAEILRQSRPTAVNLFWAIERVMKRVNDPALNSVTAIREAALAEAHAIAAEDVKTNKAIGYNALPLIPDNARIIHHCNTGSLATIDYGTALGIIRIAHEEGKQVHAWLDETRPRLQGARLSAWELKQLNIPHTVIVDGASGHVMRTIGIDLAVVGCDRVAANGDTANKIGTYNLALAAHAHGVPFYVAAPTSTIDMSLKSSAEIPIEERDSREVTHVGNCQITPDDTPVANFAFDVTPSKYITAIITEKGAAYPPFQESLAQLMRE
ncbi:MAG TPA: S-methyl-5-thioribose-1-phosphate isomerase [Chloroflexi bacterium]|nr:MAG: S-methyl-5-thioribose-1-phosphate isomerase [Anaerolineaceae bacterium 4572_5.2]HEY84783.1 S-methyl-5-thioribose-1-phosphate isomerase [Chloroflexota bacterium]